MTAESIITHGNGRTEVSTDRRKFVDFIRSFGSALATSNRFLVVLFKFYPVLSYYSKFCVCFPKFVSA